ncbi:MAG: CDP-alcohol phosphatidyltransferase [Proteobacteria bacterium]|jgi:phosphatidylcholine synthase|nr:CDP-alcohol phosphatidyltransferase [Pseudomonadota bacterium]
MKKTRVAAAWSVHFYTALGLPLAFVGAIALAKGIEGAKLFFLLNMAAVFVDSTDGTLARAVKVREVLPQFDGRRLDDLVDFIIFAFLPVLALPAFDMLPPGTDYVAVIPLMASGYGFCQEKAKTDQSFVGFPSYWNVVVLYLYVLGTKPMTNLVWILVFSALVFVPIHYLYPTKTTMLKRMTLTFGSIWAVGMIVIGVNLEAAWAKEAAWVTLVFPFYYFIISLVNHRRIHKLGKENPEATT